MKKVLKKPELLVPAGGFEKLKVGLLYGADAFYMGLPSFSMRSRENDFNEESFLEGVSLIRKAGKKFYVTVNIYPRGNKVDAFKKHLKFLREKVKPDALILADPGVFELVKEYYPEAVIHISVQANVLNYRAVSFWEKQGASRIILPRELMLSEIKEIHEKVPKMELEFFVHGAICMAYSGRCLLSNYMTGRDSNQGICAHSCRWKYKLYEGRELYLEEEMRQGAFLPIEEDSHGTYIMNSKDMCLLPYLKELVEAGICSFKVEGRNKTEYYLGIVTKTYKKAISDMIGGKKFDRGLLNEISTTANRGFIPGFLFGFPGNDSIDFEDRETKQMKKFLGIVVGRVGDLYEVSIRNRFEKGMALEVVMPDSKNIFVKNPKIFDMEKNPVEVVHGGGGNRLIGLKADIPVGTLIRF